MSQIPIESKLMRLLFEILLVVGVCESAVMFLLPEIAPNASEAVGAALDVGMLTFLSGPILLWRFTRLSRSASGSRPTWRGDPRRGIQSLAWTIIAFGIGMAITGTAAIWTYQQEHSEGQERFDHHVEKLQTDLLARFNQPLDGLTAIAGLYSAGNHVDRRVFNNFWSAVDIPLVFPGVRSFGVVEPVAPSELTHFVQRIRAEDGAGFSVHGSGDGNPLYIVRHVASPINNLSVIGLDVGAEPARKNAIEASIREGQAVLSDTISLVPLNGNRDKGVIYFSPIYKHPVVGNKAATALAPQRPLTIAFATIVLNDIVAKVMPIAAGISEFELLDGAAPGDAAVLFDSRQHQGLEAALSGAPPHEPRFSATVEVEVHGHPMQLRAYSTPEFEASRNAAHPARVATVLMLLTLFVSLSIWLLTRGRDRAQQESYQIAMENQRLAKAVQRTNNSVIIGDQDNAIVWANEAFSKISGYSLAEALGQKPSTLRHSEEVDPDALQRVRHALSQGEDVRTQMRNQAADGAIYWLDMDIQVLHGEKGEYAGFVAVETDITAERVAAQKLRSALQEARALMATVDTHAIVSEADSRGILTKVNDGFVRVCEYSREELLGNRHYTVNSGLHPESFWKDMWTTISAGQPWHGQICNRNKHGGIYWVDSMIAPFTGDDGNIEKYVAIGIDITEQKRAQEKLLTSTKLLEASQRIARVGGWELDLQSQQLFWTAETFRILETTPDEFVHSMESLARQLDADSRQRMNTALQLATDRGEGFDLELDAHTLKGQSIAIRMTCVATQTKGIVSKLTGILQDITERKQYEKSLEEARIKAELATQTKGQFLANMSHEIRTPMNAIRGMATLLQKTDLNAQQFDYASKIDGASRSLLGLINDILDFSKVEAGKMSLDLHTFRLDKLMRDLSVILSSNVGTKAIDVVFDIDPDLPPLLRGDSMRLQQILINLGGNAIKFTASGQVVISVRKQQQQADRVRIEFGVQDSGIGISGEHQSRIFEGFSQAEASTTRNFGGTGLGLSISKRLVALMDGELRVQSKPGEGSTFSFSIELVRVPDATDDAAKTPDMAVRHVLVVDDNPVAGALLARTTRSWNWPTVVAGSGEAALECVRQGAGTQPFDTIYLDWQMPVSDGWQTAKALRQWYSDAALEQPVIVMVSGNGRDTLEQRTQEEQKLLDGFLVKPVTASMVQEATLTLSTSEFRLRKRKRSSARQLEGMRILVVEDNLLNQQVAEELLNSEGAQVALAANGRLGVNAVASANPQFDAVLMDIQMPVMDGFTATKAIREKLGLQHLPIIAMTANAMAADKEECLAAGMNEHVGKPFDLAALVRTLLIQTGHTPRQDADAAEPVNAAPAKAAPAEHTLDVQSALIRMSGLKSLYLRSAQDFLQMLERCAAEYRTHCATDPAQAAMQMHTLKSTSALLGATELSQLAAQIESVCKQSGSALQAEPEASALEQAIAKIQPLLQKAIQELAPVSVPASVPVPALPTQPAAQENRDRRQLQALAELLQAEDFQALEAYAAMRPDLQHLPAKPLMALEQALQALDLAAAQGYCQQLIDQS